MRISTETPSACHNGESAQCALLASPGATCYNGESRHHRTDRRSDRAFAMVTAMLAQYSGEGKSAGVSRGNAGGGIRNSVASSTFDSSFEGRDDTDRPRSDPTLSERRLAGGMEPWGTQSRLETIACAAARSTSVFLQSLQRGKGAALSARRGEVKNCEQSKSKPSSVASGSPRLKKKFTIGPYPVERSWVLR